MCALRSGCPEHADCRYYMHDCDRVGSDLGYGDGWSSGVDFASKHAPMASHLLPVSDGRGDYYALGFLSGIVAEWCPSHETNDCRATHRCAVVVRELVQS